MEDFFKKMTSRGTPVHYLRWYNIGEHQSKLQRACEKEKVIWEHTTPNTPHLNGVTERRLAIIKEWSLAMLLNAKLNETAQKILWAEAIYTCICVINSMDTTGSTTSPFDNFYGRKLKIIGLLLEFEHIEYVTKREKFKKKTTEKN